MVSADDERRNFVLREETGGEPTVVSAQTPRQAALRAARRLDTADSDDAVQHQELQLHEDGTTKVHIYDTWALTAEPPAAAPDGLPAEITEATVSKKAIEDINDR